jgi:hypothetical protein
VLKLKCRFKSRHKPIPISLQDQHHHRSTTRQKGGLRTPLTTQREPAALSLNDLVTVADLPRPEQAEVVFGQ